METQNTIANPYREPMSTTHPFVGLEASGEYLATQHPDPIKWAAASGTITACDGKDAVVLCADGSLIPIHRVKLADPEAARAALLAAKK